MALVGDVRLEGNERARKVGDTGKEVRVERSAEQREGCQRGGVGRIVDGEHAGRRSAGLGKGGSCLENGYSGSAVMEFQCERQANDACASDYVIGVRHVSILDGCGVS